MVQEARDILCAARSSEEQARANLANLALSLFGSQRDVDLDLPPRLPARDPKYSLSTSPLPVFTLR